MQLHFSTGQSVSEETSTFDIVASVSLLLLCVPVLLLVSVSWFGKSKASSDDDEDEYVVVPVIPVDSIIHTGAHPFCDDPTCPCHEDSEEIGKVNEQYQDGLYTAPEATRRVRGWGF